MDRVNIATIDDAVYKAAEEGSQTKDFYILVDIDGLETKLEFDLSQAAALECVRIDLGGDHGLLLGTTPSVSARPSRPNSFAKSFRIYTMQSVNSKTNSTLPEDRTPPDDVDFSDLPLWGQLDD